MSRDHDDLIGVFAAFQVGDDVVAGRVGQFLWGKSEVHADLALRGKMSDQAGVFGGDRAGGKSRGKAEAGVGQAKVCGPDGAAYRAGRAQVGRGFGSGCAIANGFTVRDKRHSGGGFLLVENFIEEDDFSGDLVVAEGFQFVEVVDDDHVGSDAVGRRGSASAESGENHLLRGACGLACVFGELGGFSAANPVRNFDFLQVDIQTKRAQFGGNVIDGGFGLQRSGGARANVFG